MALERRIILTPAYDRRSDDPKKDYGVHGVNLWMAVIGEAGATSFMLFTNWQLPEVQLDSDKRMGLSWRSARWFRTDHGAFKSPELLAQGRYQALLDAAAEGPPAALNINTIRYIARHMEGEAQQRLDLISKLLETNAARGRGGYTGDPILFEVLYKPMAADLGVHSKTPLYKDHDPHGAFEYEYRDPTDEEREKGWNHKVPVPIPVTKLPICELTGTLCYYDGSGLNAERVFDVLVRQGSEGVWQELEDYYERVFNKKTEGDDDDDETDEDDET